MYVGDNCWMSTGAELASKFCCTGLDPVRGSETLPFAPGIPVVLLATGATADTLDDGIAAGFTAGTCRLASPCCWLLASIRATFFFDTLLNTTSPCVNNLALTYQEMKRTYVSRFDNVMHCRALEGMNSRHHCLHFSRIRFDPLNKRGLHVIIFGEVSFPFISHTSRSLFSGLTESKNSPFSIFHITFAANGSSGLFSIPNVTLYRLLPAPSLPLDLQ